MLLMKKLREQADNKLYVFFYEYIFSYQTIPLGDFSFPAETLIPNITEVQFSSFFSTISSDSWKQRRTAGR